MVCPEGSYTLTVDLMLDDEDVVVSTMRYFGEIKSMLNHVTPVVFLPENGIVDFGSQMQEEFRYGNMNLHGQQLSVGEQFGFIWNDDGPDLDLFVDSLSAHGKPELNRKGGRPREDDAWTSFWFEIIEIAQERRLNRLHYESQEALARELLDSRNISLSYDSIKPRISQLWHKLRIDER